MSGTAVDLGEGYSLLSATTQSGRRDSNPQQPAWKAPTERPENPQKHLYFKHITSFEITCNRCHRFPLNYGGFRYFFRRKTVLSIESCPRHSHAGALASM